MVITMIARPPMQEEVPTLRILSEQNLQGMPHYTLVCSQRLSLVMSFVQSRTVHEIHVLQDGRSYVASFLLWPDATVKVSGPADIEFVGSAVEKQETKR